MHQLSARCLVKFDDVYFLYNKLNLNRLLTNRIYFNLMHRKSMSKELFKKTVPVHTTWPTVVYTQLARAALSPSKSNRAGWDLQ